MHHRCADGPVSSDGRLVVSPPLVWRGEEHMSSLSALSCSCSVPPEPLLTSPAKSFLFSMATPSKSSTTTTLNVSASAGSKLPETSDHWPEPLQTSDAW